MYKSFIHYIGFPFDRRGVAENGFCNSWVVCCTLEIRQEMGNQFSVDRMPGWNSIKPS